MKKELLENIIQLHSFIETGKNKYSLKQKINSPLQHKSKEIQKENSENIFFEKKTREDKEESVGFQKNKTDSASLIQSKINNNLFSNNLDMIKQEVQECMKCRLYRSRKKAVFGSGTYHTKLMIIGEAPGADEDAQGLPFVGKAGQLLTKMLSAIQINREDVFITNILKCRPPQNRDPQPDEIETCTPYLNKQLEIIDPKVILALGGFAAHFILNIKEGITSLRGKSYEIDGRIIVPTFHPSALLRNESLKYPAWEDLKLLRSILEEKGFYQKS